MPSNIIKRFSQDSKLEAHLKLKPDDIFNFAKLVGEAGTTIMHDLVANNWTDSLSYLIKNSSRPVLEYLLLKKTFKTSEKFNDKIDLYDNYYTPIDLALKLGNNKIVFTLSLALLRDAKDKISINYENNNISFQIEEKSSRSIEKAALAIKCNKNIVSANFSKLQLTYEEAVLIADMLKSNPGLKSLDLNHNAIGGSGIFTSRPAWPIVVALKENKNLTELKLNNTRLSAREAYKIIEAIDYRRENGLVALQLEVEDNPEAQRLPGIKDARISRLVEQFQVHKSKYDKVVEENESLKEQILALQNELDFFKNSGLGAKGQEIKKESQAAALQKLNRQLYDKLDQAQKDNKKLLDKLDIVDFFDERIQKIVSGDCSAPDKIDAICDTLQRRKVMIKQTMSTYDVLSPSTNLSSAISFTLPKSAVYGTTEASSLISSSSVESKRDTSSSFSATDVGSSVSLLTSTTFPNVASDTTETLSRASVSSRRGSFSTSFLNGRTRSTSDTASEAGSDSEYSESLQPKKGTLIRR